MNAVKLTSTLTFRLGTLGAVLTDRFSARLAAHDLKPKHVGLLAVLDSGAAASQLDVARIMNVAPSLVVSLADRLEELGAVRRERDPADRRRQVLTLTAEGRDLLAACARAAAELDAELLEGLDQDGAETLRATLGTLARRTGLPAD
ncbi:MarR family winged helix-turn-helix transcriptional regulator [Nonomuraea rhodomycinica]|uniref:MarR family transcriptional regulator n=1 Tax=Nonomuraea rhodomycinica TaxID=1712872 RepID=A0A7Y6MAV0_9ACTN|nr:MarR family transcriptional regulator [Nonomuraea rhodomycinica]NUW40220.1 MarR family transcriptional regulator [Nonomuraea rhodomycinica]